MIIFYIFLIGTIIGSFLNVCILRIPKEESIIFPGSHCCACKKSIKTLDLIPLFSYAFLKGRSRCCKSKISLRYPAVELITGLLFALIYFQYGESINLIKYAIFLGLMLVIGFIDFDTSEVYLNTIIFGILAAVIIMIIQVYFFNYGIDKIFYYLYGGILGFCIIALIVIITGGMGWGDAEICFVCGLFLGLKNILILIFISFIIGGILGSLLLALNKKSRKDFIPFGPFITISSIITTLFCTEIARWYLSIL